MKSPHTKYPNTPEFYEFVWLQMFVFYCAIVVSRLCRINYPAPDHLLVFLIMRAKTHFSADGAHIVIDCFRVGSCVQ